MKTNPYYNGILAGGYIAAIVSFLTWIGRVVKPEDNAFAPMIFLSLLTFSVALMGFLFFYEPAILIRDGKQAEAARFFLKTLVTFAGIAIVFATFGLFIFR